MRQRSLWSDFSVKKQHNFGSHPSGTTPFSARGNGEGMGNYGAQPRPSRLPVDASPLSSWAIRRRVFVPPSTHCITAVSGPSELDSPSRERRFCARQGSKRPPTTVPLPKEDRFEEIRLPRGKRVRRSFCSVNSTCGSDAVQRRSGE